MADLEGERMKGATTLADQLGALLQEHGAPVRVVIPDMYGYKNVKWVERISLVPEQGSG